MTATTDSTLPDIDSGEETTKTSAPPRTAFRCTVCGGADIARQVARDDGARIVFCGRCDMGVVDPIPDDTAQFYTDDYYRSTEGSAHGYVDYEFTAEHSLLWVRVLIETLFPAGGTILDIGCATGFLLKRLDPAWRRSGIEANPSAAAAAAEAGIDILGPDVLAPGLAATHRDAFDVVTSIATFEHVRDIRGAVAASLEMLAPQGVLILEVPVISATRSNRDWYGGSFEHIYYPTGPGLRALFADFPGVHFLGAESAITGFSSTYIGLACRDADRFAELSRLFAAMTAEDPTHLPEAEARLNLAYTVVHDFRPAPPRIARLPLLLERYYAPNLGKRLMQLWHADAARACLLETRAANGLVGQRTASPMSGATYSTVPPLRRAVGGLARAALGAEAATRLRTTLGRIARSISRRWT
ncbi:MAG: methyltransferase domain-containing protein [Rhodospirillales bacterium]|nr:methyltransferase domain-containing protein [Rhodospirillales bacterium]